MDEVAERADKSDPQEAPKQKRERKETVRPAYDFCVTFLIIRSQPYQSKVGYDIEMRSECRVVVKDDELELWRTFWSLRGMEIIECDEDWTQPA